MSRFYSYLKNAAQILSGYNGAEPFASFLKKYFGRNRKYGSNDRKQIARLCYSYFRLGKALRNRSVEDRILTGLFLCSDSPNEMLDQLKPVWNEKVQSGLKEKLSIVNHSLLIEEVFPWKSELSGGLDHGEFCESFFIQPDLFIRLRPGYENLVKTKLSAQGISFSEISSSCLSLPNASRIENIIELDKQAVVQDFSSQQTGIFFKNIKHETSNLKSNVWDCCAGSGGKSLLLYDLDPNIELTVSDIRESILINLRKRFAKAGIRDYKSFVADLTKKHFHFPTASDANRVLPSALAVAQGLPQAPHYSPFDLIICDAPCTGSGTWSRTPEQLYFFDEEKIDQYALLQKRIVSNVIPSVKENGWLLYITCSVFKKENEEVVGFIRSNSKLELIQMELLKGYDKKADSIFAALFKKKL